MKSARCAILAIAALLPAIGPAGALADEPLDGGPLDGGPAIHVPSGFAVERVAAPPLIEHPLMAGFDERGRLFVADNAGLNLPIEELQKKLPNLVRRLEDSNGDGRFDRSTVFADQMTMPQGALWHDGALYVASPPYIWRLEDTNDDGVADRREPIVGKFGSNGNAADIHGCFLGPNGRIYWCDGRHGHELADSQGHATSKGLAARIFSCRPDGSDVQTHCGGGMDNPVEIDFLPTGEMLGTVNLMYGKRGDCLVHWMHGGVYPREDQQACLDEFKRTGGLLPEVTNLGHSAVSGLTRYRGTTWGDEFRDNVFICQFNTHKVSRTILAREGSTFRARDEDFLTCDSPDFHPTDVLEDADGSLLLIDTGGWFRIGCPTSQIAKPQVPGAIYRIRRVGARPAADPRGLKLAWQGAGIAELIARLSDQRPAVRDRAVTTLARRGAAALPALAGTVRKSPEKWARLNAVWVLTRIGTPAAGAALQIALNDCEPDVRQAAAGGLGTLGDGSALDALCRLVVGDEPPVRREAATTLGRLRSPRAVPAILEALHATVDRLLEHALIYALIEINDRDATVKGLADSSPKVRRGALIALEQMDAGGLTRQLVTPQLDTDDRALQQAAIEIISKRAGWADELVGLLRKWLGQSPLDADRQASLRGTLLAFRGDGQIQSLIAEALSESKTSPATRVLLLEVVARADVRRLPESWVAALDKALAAGEVEVRSQAVVAVAGHAGQFLDALERLGHDAAQPIALRSAAIAAVAKSGRSLDDQTWSLLLGRLQDTVPPLERLAAADSLSSAALSPSQLAQVIAAIEHAGPLELPALGRACEKSSDGQLGLRLVASLSKSPGLASLSADRLREILAHYPSEVTTAGQELVARLAAARSGQQTRLAEMEPLVARGDLVRGKELFFGARAACSACHAVAEQGGQVGPDLTKIGGIRSPRDLLESVLFPSVSFARGYEVYRVVSTAGLVYTGVIRRETADAIWLRSADLAEVRIQRDEIDELALSPTSIMPEGLEKLLSPEDLANVVAYLKTLK